MTKKNAYDQYLERAKTKPPLYPKILGYPSFEGSCFRELTKKDRRSIKKILKKTAPPTETDTT